MSPPSSFDDSPHAFRGPLPPSRFNLTRYCLEAGRQTPDAPALIVISDHASEEPSEVWTYSQVEQAILRLASALKTRGLKTGDRVLIRLKNRSEYAFLFFASIAAGFVAVPASADLSARELDFLIADAKPTLIALDAGLAVGDLPPDMHIWTASDIKTALSLETVTAYADTGSEDPAFLVYTSGTTAAPKGVLHAQRAIWGRRPMIDGWYALRPSDRMLHAGAFNWTYTLGTGLQDPWARGATALIFTGAKTPSIWPRLMEKYAVTLFAAVPSLYRQILKYSDIEKCDLRHLRHGLTAGEALPEFVREEWVQRTGKPLFEALGMSEVSTFISESPNVPPRTGTVGRPQEGRSIAILPPGKDERQGHHESDTPLLAGTEGLLCVHRSDPGLMLGYWNRADEEQTVFRGEWFCGGDLAIMDEDGYVRHLGRNNDIMNALGYRVSPLEIESVLNNHHAVAEAGASEIEIKPGLSIICAFVVLTNQLALKEETLDAFARENLAAYKVPKKYIFVDSLPKTANGKIKRTALKQLYRVQITG